MGQSDCRQAGEREQAEQSDATHRLVDRNAHQHEENGCERADDRERAPAVCRANRREELPGSEGGQEDSRERSGHQQVKGSFQPPGGRTEGIDPENRGGDEREPGARTGAHNGSNER